MVQAVDSRLRLLDGTGLHEMLEKEQVQGKETFDSYVHLHSTGNIIGPWNPPVSMPRNAELRARSGVVSPHDLNP